MFWVIAASLVLCFACGCLVSARRRLVPHANVLASTLPRLSVVIPARNEAENLPTLLASLKDQSYELEIIVVDDSSSDGTAEVAAQWGAMIVRPPALPSDWTGKNWACYQGALVAQGELICFVDADVFFEPQSLVNLVALFSEQPNCAISVLPFHQIKKFYEEFSVFFNLLMAMGTGAMDLKAANAMLVGQCMLIPRSIYFKSGGHEAVKGQVLENFYLTRVLRQMGVSCETYLGKESVSVRMFPLGWGQLIEGWTKGFVSGSKGAPARALLLSISWIFGLMTLLVLFISGYFESLFSVFYTLAVGQLIVFSRRLGNFSWLVSVFFFVPLVFYQAVFFRSMWMQWRKSPLSWRGRTLPSGRVL